jgi:transposase-like protein
MMSKTRREFAPEFKREAVALLEGSGRPLTQVAGESDVVPIVQLYTALGRAPDQAGLEVEARGGNNNISKDLLSRSDRAPAAGDPCNKVGQRSHAACHQTRWPYRTSRR